jgi:hypothetical protein
MRVSVRMNEGIKKWLEWHPKGCFVQPRESLEEPGQAQNRYSRFLVSIPFLIRDFRRRLHASVPRCEIIGEPLQKENWLSPRSEGCSLKHKENIEHEVQVLGIRLVPTSIHLACPL